MLEAKNQIATLQQANTAYITKVEQAQKDYAAAKSLAQDYGTKAADYKEDNDSLVEVNTVLEKKLSTASIIRIAGLKAAPVRERKGRLETTEKANKVERLKLSFSVLASELTEKEEKEIIIRILAPNGTVLTENTSKLSDTEDLVSLTEKITYDGTEKGVTYYYDQEADYAKGLHKVELFHNEKLLDRTTFSLR